MSMKPHLALSIRQPWAWMILNLGKDIENRDWFTWFRGTIAVHVSKTMTRGEFEIARDFVLAQFGTETANKLPPFGCYELGAIVGTVEIIDCVKESDSPWFTGDFGFVLAYPKPLIEPVRIRGALKFWEVPNELKTKIIGEKKC